MNTRSRRCGCMPGADFYQLDSKMMSLMVSGMQATLTGGSGILDDGMGLRFNNLLANNTSLSLDPLTGIFTVNRAGQYLVLFYINIDGSESSTTVSFSANTVQSQAVNAVQGQMSGFALLSLAISDTIQITNSSGQKVLLSGDIQAGVIILQL